MRNRNKQTKITKSEQSHRPVGHYQLCQYKHNGRPRRGKTEKDRRIYEEKMSKNIQNIRKHINLLILKAQQTACRINSKRAIPRHIITKLSRQKRESWKRRRETAHHIQGILTYKGLTADFSLETTGTIFKVLTEEELTKNSISSKTPSK